jgi:oligopeptide transport system permease protein
MNQTPTTTTTTTGTQPGKASKRLELERLVEIMSAAQMQQGVSLWSDGWKRLKRNRVSMISLWTLVVIVVLAIITPALPLQSPIFQDVKQRELLRPEIKSFRLGIADYNEDLASKRQELIEMSTSDSRRAALPAEIESLEARHPINALWNDPGFISKAMIEFRLFVFGDYCIPSICGTDKLGRDILSRVCWGSRVSLACGLIATLVSLLIGVSYGAISGYFGGRIDNIMMRIIDVAYSIPFIFIVIFIMSFLSAPKVRDTLNEYGINQITIFFLMIGAIYWLTMARVVRGQVLSLKNEQFVDAAKTIGTSQWGIIFKHLVPNVMGIVIVYLTLTIPAVIRFEAFLSFLGMGVQAPDISWGMLVNEGIQVITPIRIYWWMIVFSGFALALTLFSLNFLGDGVRDALDPKLKNR